MRNALQQLQLNSEWPTKNQQWTSHNVGVWKRFATKRFKVCRENVVKDESINFSWSFYTWDVWTCTENLGFNDVFFECLQSAHTHTHTESISIFNLIISRSKNFGQTILVRNKKKRQISEDTHIHMYSYSITSNKYRKNNETENVIRFRIEGIKYSILNP